jgi:hypothetical protein
LTLGGICNNTLGFLSIYWSTWWSCANRTLRRIRILRCINWSWIGSCCLGWLWC